MNKAKEIKIYSELELKAIKWLKETDTFQFSQMELLTMFAEFHHQSEVKKSKVTKAVKYMISVWNEVTGGTWKNSPDHVQQMFIEAETELNKN